MKSRTAWKKGAILLQTLVMAILLSMIAIMVMKWVLARYILVGHMHRSIAANTRGEGYSAFRLCNSNWQTAAVANSSVNIDSPPKSLSLTATGSISGTAVQTIRVDGNEDEH